MTPSDILMAEQYELYQYQVNIRRVIDGDTVDVDIDLGFGIILRDQRVRIQGIDTPECRTKDLEEKMFGRAAKHFVQGLLPENSTQVMKTILDKDGDVTKGKFGRILADFYISDGKMLSDAIMDAHHGVPYEGGDKSLLEAMHQANRDILKASGEVRV